eukprot:scaffold8727_cov45-Phaeocystis_antarctica.AAC.1
MWSTTPLPCSLHLLYLLCNVQVRHFAGDVAYSCANFLEKNNDSLDQHFKQVRPMHPVHPMHPIAHTLTHPHPHPHTATLCISRLQPYASRLQPYASPGALDLDQRGGAGDCRAGRGAREGRSGGGAARR